MKKIELGLTFALMSGTLACSSGEIPKIRIETNCHEHPNNADAVRVASPEKIDVIADDGEDSIEFHRAGHHLYKPGDVIIETDNATIRAGWLNIVTDKYESPNDVITMICKDVSEKDIVGQVGGM